MCQNKFSKELISGAVAKSTVHQYNLTWEMFCQYYKKDNTFIPSNTGVTEYLVYLSHSDIFYWWSTTVAIWFSFAGYLRISGVIQLQFRDIIDKPEMLYLNIRTAKKKA